MKKILSALLFCLILVGCAAPQKTGGFLPGNPKSTVPEQGSSEMLALAETTAPVSDTPETAPVEHFLTLYAPNEDATGFIYASFEVPELSADAICNGLIGAKVLNGDVIFNRLTVENGEVKLDVNAAFGRQLMSYGTAGEYMMVGSVVNTLLSACNAETVYITMDGGILESGHVIYDFPLEFYESQSEAPLNDLPPMVMVDGKLYIDTGNESTVTGRCGMMDGIIESQVDSWQEPGQNNQSNFGIGFGYQYGQEPGTIEVNIDGSWYVYAAVEEMTGLPN